MHGIQAVLTNPLYLLFSCERTLCGTPVSSMNPYRRIFGSLNDAGVRYIIVGGVAMNLLGYPRFTGDIDILLALDKKNLSKMAGLMKKMHYEKRIPASIEELGDEKKVLALMKEKNLLAYTFANPAEPQFSIDVIVGNSLQFDDYEKRSSRMPVWDIKIPVISIDDLIGMKKKTKRRKDDEDVAMLLTLKGL